MVAAADKRRHCSREKDVRTSGSRSRIIAGSLAASLALGSLGPVSADGVRQQGVRVPPGIMAGVPSGGSPGPARVYVSPPYVGSFYADPWFAGLPVVVAPPPILLPPPPDFDVEPLEPPFDDGCFVQSDNVGQHGYYGSCAESFYRQWTARPD
jgi:hypothetical protein